MIQLFQHQKIALALLRIHAFFALFMEQGTGKTLPALFRALDLLTSDKAGSVLIVTVKSAMGAWERDIDRFEPQERETLRCGVTVINYDKVWRYTKGSNPFDRQYRKSQVYRHRTGRHSYPKR